MGASSIMNSSSSSDIDSARADRYNRNNPPEFAPGQGEDDDLFDDDLISSDIDLGGGASTQPTSFGGMNGMGMTGMNGLNGAGVGMGQPNQMNAQGQQGTAIEDRMIEGAINGAKGTINFTKAFVQSFKGLTPKFWSVWGSRTFVVGSVVAVVGLVFLLFGLGSVAVNLMVGGLLSLGTGGLLLMLNTEKARECTSRYVNDPNMTAPQPDMTTNPASMDTDIGNDFSNDDFGDYDDFDDFGADDEDFSSGSDEEDEDLDFFSDIGELPPSEPPHEGVSKEEALESMVIPERGLVTRQYMYDMFTKVLDNIKPDFATVKTISEESDVFFAWESNLREAAKLSGAKEDSLPELISLEENLFTIKLTFSRTTGLKYEAVGEELANIYAYSSGEFNSAVYAKSEALGAKCIVTIFTGETALISLKDMYAHVKDFMLDTKHYMPVVLGINPQGKVIVHDFKKLESVLITGMPRSGKSWFVQCVLTQLCVFVSPTELNIYICDPKEGISDFKSFKLPHVKKFVSGDANIVNTLRQVVKQEAPRRKKIIGDAGFVNIWDFKERNPDVHMPIIYILIDEVVTLAERMDKEVKAEFQGLLKELISQLPALGIRAFLIPHVVKNDIIAKTATDLIPCRISVMGDAGHIESSTGTKPKDFPYKLTNVGDMAVRIPQISPQTMFIHGAALSDSNPKNNDLFEYLLKVWAKLEPEEVRSSVSANYAVEDSQKVMVADLNLDDVDDVDVFANTHIEANSVNRYQPVGGSAPVQNPEQRGMREEAQAVQQMAQPQGVIQPQSQSEPARLEEEDFDFDDDLFDF